MLPTNSLSVFDHFVGLAFKGLNDVFPWKQSKYFSFVLFFFCLCLFFYLAAFIGLINSFAQPALICSNLTIKKLEQGAKYVQSQ